ncbi:TPA_asm: UL41 iORF RNA |nr:TPA_asm: UL41 iORF RNA \
MCCANVTGPPRVALRPGGPSAGNTPARAPRKPGPLCRRPPAAPRRASRGPKF